MSPVFRTADSSHHILSSGMSSGWFGFVIHKNDDGSNLLCICLNRRICQLLFEFTNLICGYLCDAVEKVWNEFNRTSRRLGRVGTAIASRRDSPASRNLQFMNVLRLGSELGNRTPGAVPVWKLLLTVSAYPLLIAAFALYGLGRTICFQA